LDSKLKKIVIIAIMLCILLPPFLAKAQTSSPEPAVLDHFSFDYISNGQTVGIPFKITITAMDQYNHTFTGYNGANTLEATEINFEIVDISKWYHVSLGVTGPFANGVWSGHVTIPEAFHYWEISTSGGGKSGASNWFTVYNPPTTPSPSPTVTPTLSPTPAPTPTVPEFPAALAITFLIALTISVPLALRKNRDRHLCKQKQW
jgi:hypothetical protein